MSPPEPPNKSNRTRGWGFLAGFAFCLVLVEILFRSSQLAATLSQKLARRGQLQSLADITARIGNHSGEKLVFFLGDSVLGASALHAHHVADWEASSLSSQLDLHAQAARIRTVNLSADGALIPDISLLTKAAAALAPQQVIIFLNVRMFAEEFEHAPNALSNPLLETEESCMSEEPRVARRPEQLPERLDARIYNFLSNHVQIFAASQSIRALLYYPSAAQFYERVAELLVHEPINEDLKDAALQMKITPYYRGRAWPESALPTSCLTQTIARLSASNIQSTVIMTPQNPSFIEGMSAETTLHANVQKLREILLARAGSGVHFIDWSGALDSSDFLDHCHLTSSGNSKLANMVYESVLSSLQ